MSRKRARNRIYTRSQGGLTRYYADFRDLGGRREALVVPGEKLATTAPDLAEALAAKRLGALQRLRAESQGRAVAGLPKATPLGPFASAHLVAKARAGECTDEWMAGEETRLTRAVEFLGPDRDLSAITVGDVQRWNEALVGQGLAGGTRRQHLNSLSNLFRYAQALQAVAPGYNPVAAMMHKPTGRRAEAHWLEVPEAALLLEAARTYEPKRGDVAVPFAYELLATCLLTGGRPAEVLGLEVDDVSFDRSTVTFRPNLWRRLKTLSSLRTVPLWPQLEEILRPYILPADRTPRRGLLFPSYRTGEEAMVTDCRKLLDAIGARVGYLPRELNLYALRHTYCAARLQTLDGAAPVSPYTVGKELGHGGVALVNRIYGHLGEVRHRAKVVEYRAKQHRKAKHRERAVSEWLKALVAARA